MTQGELRAFLDSAHDVVALGMREHLAAERLRRSTPPEDLRDSLVAMLARSADEQERLAVLFDASLQTRRKGRPQRLRSWLRRTARRVLPLLLLGLLALTLRPIVAVQLAQKPKVASSGEVKPTAEHATTKQVRLKQVQPETVEITTSRAPLPLPPLALLLPALLLSLLLCTTGLRLILLPAALGRERPVEDQRRLDKVRAAHREVIAAGLRRSAPLVLYRVPALPPFTPAEREDLANLFGALRRSEHGLDLDVLATLDQTLERGSQPTPVFQTERRPRELLVLYDREQRDDYPDLAPFLRLLDDWERRALRVTRYAFHRQPDRLLPRRGPSLPLAEALRRHPQAVLLLFSRRQHSELSEQRAWLRVAQHWELRAWIDPDPLVHKRERPERLCAAALKEAGLQRFPFTLTGLKALARHLAEGGLGPGPPPWPAFPGPEPLTGPLRLWAAAAALVPEASWDQLEVFRAEVPELSAALTDRRDVHRLLAALRVATRQPSEAQDGRTLALSRPLVTELQTWLLQQKPAVVQRVVTILKDQLGEAPPSTEAADPYAFWLWSLKVAFLHMVRDRSAAPVEALLDSPFGEDAADRLKRELQGPVLQRQEKARVAVSVGLQEGLTDRDLWRAAPRSWLRGLAAGMTAALLLLSGHQLLLDSQRAVQTVRPATFEVDERRREDATAERPALIEVLPGEFLMDSPAGEEGRYPDEKQHPVRITRPYYLAATEVTQAQYLTLMKTNPSSFKGDDQRPVEMVSWFDAVDYCNALSKREGRPLCYQRKGESVTWQTDCTGYRLPTEAEWEYAARADQPTLYSGSNDPVKVAWFDKDSENKTHPVGLKNPNAWGFHDLSGNVCEWVWDLYANSYSEEVMSVDYASDSAAPKRVHRSGSFWFAARFVRISARDKSTPGARGGNLGFRVARSLP